MHERFRMQGGCSVRRTRDAHRQAGELLLALGITPHTAGYAMLRDGSRLVADCDRCRQIGMTEALYPLIGTSFGRRAGAEHAMRDAIRTAWRRMDGEAFEKEAPSNAALLYRLAGQLAIVREREK